jgi:acyl carrier protein
MELEKFVENFAMQFDETDICEFSPSKRFKEIPEWSSLMALSIIAMVDEEYNVQIKGDDIRKSQTIEELFNIVKSRK